MILPWCVVRRWQPICNTVYNHSEAFFIACKQLAEHDLHIPMLRQGLGLTI